MTEQDIKNNETIFNIVQNHFGLNEESLSRFKEEIFSPTIEPFYFNILKDSKNLRVYYTIPKEILSTIDNGWKIFTLRFSSFINQYNFFYTNFAENKILINKNSIKTRKALISFYTNLENFDYFVRDIYHNIQPRSNDVLDWKNKKIISEDLNKKIIEHIDVVLDEVSQKCLPKTEIKLVLSLNFADWFLCSTAESWKSCLNLESEFHGAYWTGLPGLVGDKNRCLFYITDGTKKTYQGITVDKVIARSWGLLSVEDILYINKPYPLANLFDARIVSTITKLKTKDLGNSNDFVSKNKVKLLFYKSDKQISSFIFQDNSGFSPDLFIKRAPSGIYIYNDGRITRGEPVVRYEGGLINLIQKKETIEKYIIKRLVCEFCGHRHEEVAIYNINGEEHQICPSCLRERYKKCPICKEWHPKEDLIEAIDGFEENQKICPTCIKRFYKKCDICNTYHRKQDLSFVYDMYKNKTSVCGKCLKNIPDIELCEECGSYMPESMITQANLLGTEYMCESCQTIHRDKKQTFFTF